MNPRKISLIVCAIFVGTVFLCAAETGDRLALNGDSLTPSLRATAMPELGEGRLARILTRYYTDALGGAENWAEISSIKYSGTLDHQSGTFAFTALQKKPDLMKITLRRNSNNLVMASDGKHLWTRPPGPGAEAVQMEGKEARRFQHSTIFGTYMLFPYAEGKELVYMDTVPVEGNICHQIRVTLDTGFQIDYFIDIRSYLEVKVENLDLQSGATNSILYSNYVREDGMPIARKIESYEEGELVSTLTVEDARVNAGLIPWMFEMPK